MKTAAEYFDTITKKMSNVIYFIMGCFVVAIFLMVIIQVFFRYVLQMSMGGMEELPVYIMAMCAWFAAPVATINDNHVVIDLIPNLFKGRVRIGFSMFAQFVAFLSMAFFAKLAFDYVGVVRGYGEVTGGIGIPIWAFHTVIAVGATLVSFFSLTNLIRNIGRFIKWEEN
jgi:TRAP-type C4-dicarboxylate transport system permease small subunit